MTDICYGHSDFVTYLQRYYDAAYSVRLIEDTVKQIEIEFVKNK